MPARSKASGSDSKRALRLPPAPGPARPHSSPDAKRKLAFADASPAQSSLASKSFTSGDESEAACGSNPKLAAIQVRANNAKSHGVKGDNTARVRDKSSTSKGSSHRNGGSSSKAKSWSPARTHAKDSPATGSTKAPLDAINATRAGNLDTRGHVVRAKQIFDAIDSEGNGYVTLEALLDAVGNGAGAANVANAFSALDRGRAGTLSFEDVLCALYPRLPLKEIRKMVVEASVAQVTQNDIKALCAFFEDSDDNFDGKLSFGVMRDLCANHPKFQVFARDAVPAKHDELEVEFPDFCLKLFARTQRKKLGEIQSWAGHCKVRTLNAQQQRELEYLFSQYDQDRSGTVNAQELKAHFEKDLQLGGEETEAMFQACMLARLDRVE